MKILAICQYYDPEPFVISRMLEQLVSFGHEVHVVTGLPNYGYGKILEGYEGREHREEEIGGVKVHRVKIKPRRDSKWSICMNYLSFWHQAKRYVKKLDDSFDLVFSMTLSPVISVSAANWYAKKHHVPHLLYCVDLWPESLVVTNTIRSHGLAYRFFYRWSRKIYQGADRILVSSPSFIDYFNEVLHLDHPTLGVLNQPALPVTITDEPVVYDPEYLHIVYCGNHGKLQNLSYIYETLQQYPDLAKVQFHMIGMGSQKQAFFAEVERRGLQKQIIDHGPLAAAKAAAYFINADALYVSLSQNGYVGKTIPNKLTFYLSFAKPILAMIQHDGRQLLEATKGAVLLDESCESLYQGLKKLLAMSANEKADLGSSNKAYFDQYAQLSVLSRQLEQEILALQKSDKSLATEASK